MLECFVLAAAVAAAVAAVELKRLTHAILALALMNALVAAAFYIAGAHLLSAFQFTIYTGALSILMLAMLHAGEEREV